MLLYCENKSVTYESIKLQIIYILSNVLFYK